jgi:hypothetical protein
VVGADYYPLVSELPAVVDARKWEWKPFADPWGNLDFFVGTDELGNQWLTKLRGGFRGYREIVFERLVQSAGWRCQSSTFAILESRSLSRCKIATRESTQIVTRLLREHGAADCNPGCPIGQFRGDLFSQDGDPLVRLAASPLTDALNFAREQILAPLLGGVEPAGCLTTLDHQVFLIDGELMFAGEPSDVRKTSWWKRRDGSPWPNGQRLTHSICAVVGSFEDYQLQSFLEKPAELKIELSWQICPLLYNARDYARAFSRSEKWREGLA